MKKVSFILAIILLLSFISIQKEEITIYMIGDSTMANKPLNDNPERGWGQLFSRFFNDKVKVENHAMNGRSTKSFIDESRWDTILLKLKKGDYVFIQFAHNDEKKENPKVYAEAHTAYKQNLLKFVNNSRSKGAIPILMTPVMRRRFDDKGVFFDTHSSELGAIKNGELAVEGIKELNIDLKKYLKNE
jgi:DNA sulfur modification protein DndE